MSRKLFYEFILTAMLFFGLWLMSSYLFSHAKKPIEKINEYKQKKIGDIFYIKIKKVVRVVRSPELSFAMKEIKSRLISSGGLDTAGFNIYVIHSETINAFALPGNNIIILSGLIKFSENPEEVAAVVAHEIGHLHKGHITQRIIRHAGISILFSIGGADPGIIRELIQHILSSVFDRDQEAEADNYAFELMAKSGIDPGYFAKFFERLQATQGSLTGKLEFIMSHPHEEKRIRNAKNFQLPLDFHERKFDHIGWDEIKKGM